MQQKFEGVQVYGIGTFRESTSLGTYTRGRIHLKGYDRLEFQVCVEPEELVNYRLGDRYTLTLEGPDGSDA